MSLYIGLIASFLAMFVKGLAAFGNTLVFSPIMNFQSDTKMVAPVDLLMTLPANAYMAWIERKNISLKIVLPLVLLIYIGLIPGTFFLTIGNSQLLKVILGIAVVVLGIEMILREASIAKHGKKPSKPIVLILIGLVSGMLCGLFGVGAFLTAYLNRTTDDQKSFRANFCCVFFLENIARLALYIYTGLMTISSVKFALMIAPTSVLGLLCGLMAAKKIPEKHAKKVVAFMLILTGLSLAAQNISGLFDNLTNVFGITYFIS